MPGLSVTPTLQALYGALVPFIIGVTGLSGAQVIQGVQNRAPMPSPSSAGFILVQAINRTRLRTNLHHYSLAPSIEAQLEEGVELTVQIDCYGTSACDWADMLSATLRDEYGCTALAPTLSPLYADEARMIPLVDGEDQYEERWMLTAAFQFNPVTTIPQQYADVLDLTLVNVEKAYPA
jgi:hypothetical protein